jgi:TatD DNase family protein
MFIDTHAHLNFPEISANIGEVLKRAEENGVEKIIVPSTSLQTSLDVIELVQKYDMLYGAVGIHPTELIDFMENHLYELEKLAGSEKIIAIGEIGLDYYWKPYNAELEQYVLKAQIRIAKNNNLPVIIHNRESSADLMNILREEYKDGSLKGQLHSFSGDMMMAEECVNMGLYISLTGNITYKPNDKTFMAYEIVKNTAVDNLLLETDSPYMTPVPFRGKQNEPGNVKYTAEKIAELKNISVEELGKFTTQNAKKLFDIE